jgi:hypothetical protein
LGLVAFRSSVRCRPRVQRRTHAATGGLTRPAANIRL